MTGLIDDRLTKVLSFTVGTTYGSHTVESRTPCYVTFAGESRKRIAIVNGIEVVDVNRAITASLAVVAPETAEVESTSIVCTMPSPIKVVEPSIEEVEVIAASLGYRLVNLSTAYSNGCMWRLYRDGLLLPSKHYGCGLNLLDVRAYLEAERYQKRFDIEVPSAMEACYSPVLGSSRCVIRNIEQCGYAIATLLPDNLDEPDWFYADDDRPEFDFARFHAERAMYHQELLADRVANFELSLGGSI